MDRLTSLRVFQTIGETGSFSAAAERLGLSAAMASKHVHALEQQLGTRLFQRTTRRVSLTEAGQDYARRIALVLAQ
ncbi:LysR family transcriptional regulator, partial [Laribacter hongkongensis]